VCSQLRTDAEGEQRGRANAEVCVEQFLDTEAEAHLRGTTHKPVALSDQLVSAAGAR
jgi:hypothetical protein